MKDMLNNNETSINLDEVLESARKIAEEVREHEESKMDNFRRIIEGVARKYASIYVDREDLEQELWLTTLQLIERCGGEEFTDAKLVAKHCYNRAVDFYRYSRRRKDSTRAMLEDYEMYDEEKGEGTGSADLFTSDFRTGMDAVMVHEIIDLFPQGSKERKYIVTKLYMYGEIDKTDDLPDDLELPQGETEADVLHMLGYTGKTASASWMKLKNQMKKKIYTHLGFAQEVAEDMPEEKKDEAIRVRVEEIFKSSASYYIYTKKILKDVALRVIGCDEQKLLQVMKDSEKLVIGIGWSSNSTYLMKNEEKYIQIAQEEGDTLYLK